MKYHSYLREVSSIAYHHAKTAITQSIYHLSGVAGPALAFTAVISSIVLPDLERFDRLTFDDVLTNVGGAYDETEGTFVAPFDAVYIFTIDIMLQGGTHQYLDIMRNTVRMLDVYLEATPTNYLSSSRTVTMQLATGDEVWIRINAGDRSIYGNHQSTFSGWLVTVL